MSNNCAVNSSLVIAQKAVKQLRLEAGVRRIKVRVPPARHVHQTASGARDSRSFTCRAQKLIPFHQLTDVCGLRTGCCATFITGFLLAVLLSLKQSI